MCINLKKFVTSLDFSEYVHNLIRTEAWLEHEVWKYEIIHVRLINPIVNKTSVYAYPYILKDIKYKEIFEKSREGGKDFILVNLEYSYKAGLYT